MQSSALIPGHTRRQLFIAEITCAEVGSVLPLLPTHTPCGKLAAPGALSILVIAGITGIASLHKVAWSLFKATTMNYEENRTLLDEYYSPPSPRVC